MSDCSKQAWRVPEQREPGVLYAQGHPNVDYSQIEAIEVNGQRFERMCDKTCEVECFDDGVDEGMDGEWFTYAPPTWHLSCGHKVFGDERPNFCPHCRAKVVSADD